MSRARPWYPHYPADFLQGTMVLSLEEKGAYIVCLDLMYERGGPIPDDPKWIAHVCGCPLQRWKKIRKRLKDAGKLHLTEDGKSLVNGRMSYEMSRARVVSEAGKRSGIARRNTPVQENVVARDVGIQGKSRKEVANKVAENMTTSFGLFGMDDNNINGLASQEGELLTDSQTQKEERGEKEPRGSSSPSSNCRLTRDQQTVVDAWVEMAKATDLAIPRTFTNQRRKHMAERLREHGVDGMLEAIKAIGKSALCHGANKTGWRADFDFLLQPKSCVKAREGSYADNKPKNANGRDPSVASLFG